MKSKAIRTAILLILASTLAFVFAPVKAVPHSITVDGDPSDWIGTAPITSNTGTYSGFEYIWVDEVGDDTGNGTYTYPTGAAFSGAEADLTELRITRNATHVMFLLRFVNITDNGWWAGAPYLTDIQAETTAVTIAIDTDRVEGSGYWEVDDGIGAIAAEINLTSAGWWEYLFEIALADVVLWRWDSDFEEVWEATREIPTAVNVDNGYEAIEVAVPIDPTGLEGLPDPTDAIWRFFVFVGSQDFEHYREVNAVASEWYGGGGTDDVVDPDAYDCAFFATRADQEAALNGFSEADGTYCVISAYMDIDMNFPSIPYEHELTVFLDAPTRLKPGDSSLLNATVYNRGLSNETNVELFLLINGTIVNNVTIPELVNGTSYTIDHLWTPTVEATYNVTAYAPPVPDENVTINNVATKIVSVRAIRGYVLFDQTHGTDSITYYSTWVTDLTDRDYVVDTHTIGSITPSVLAGYDILVIPQALNTYSSSELSAIQGFVSSGGGLLVIGDDSPSVYTDLTGFASISWIGGGASGTTTDITPHEITEGVTSIYLDAPIAEMQVTAPALDLVRDPAGGIMLAVSELVGRVIGFADEGSLWDYGIVYADNLRLANNMIDWLVGVRYEHELTVSLDAPNFLEPGESSLLKATVYNRGLNNETVDLFLLINGTVVNSTAIIELVNGTSYTINYLWTPTVEATYNVTAYAPPVPDENVTANNVDSAFVAVGFAVKAFVLDSWGTDFDTTAWEILNTNWYTYGNTIVYIDYTTLNIDDISYSDIAATDADVLIISCAYDWEFTDSEIDAITQYVLEGHGLIATAGTLYYWVPNNNKLAPLFGLSETVTWDATSTDLLNILDPAHPLFVNIPDPYILYKTTTIPSDYAWDSNELMGGIYVALGDYLESAIVVYNGLVFISPWVEYMPTNDDLQLLYNAITWSRYTIPEHELTVSLEAPEFLEPSEPILLNATVYNRGLNNETSVDLFLMINGTIVNSTTISELLTGSSYTLSYLWTPMVKATYNVTAYAPPVPDENVTANNLVSRMVHVRYVEVALISEYSELLAITPILNSMGTGYDIYNNNYMYRYTEDLDLLLTYTAVILYKSSRWLTSDEYSALESYLSSGGNLLVTGFDTLVSDSLLADLVRSSTYGDNTGEPDLYVVDASHPIMNGPYGSFPAGYHISGLSSDCDRVEADTARGAVTVAELADGYDKIIATEGLPGKVVFWNGVGTSDWTWNVDCEAMFKNTLAWFIIQYEHELTVSLEAPTFLKPGDSSLLNATIYNRGLNNETNVELRLLINGTVVDSTVISFLQVDSSYTLSYLWTPTAEGTYNVTVYAPPVLDENVTANNIYSTFVTVRFAPRILAYVQYTDYYQEYTNALRAIDSTFGPAYILTELWDYTQLDSMLPGNDILLIPEQEYSYLSMMQTIGATWSETLSNFLEEGGVIIVYDYSGGSHGILTGAGLMSISSVNYITGWTVYLVDPTDPLASGVSSSFTAPSGALSFVTDETNVVFDDGTYPVVIHKKVGQGHIVLIGFDYYASNPDTEQILGNAVDLALYMTISISPSAGSPGTEVTVTGIKATANGTVEIYWDEMFIGNAKADAVGSFTYLLTVPLNATAGPHEIRAVDVATGETSSKTFRVIFITINPLSGPVGTKVTTNGAGFSAHTQVVITFNDMLLGYAMTDDTGNFTFIFNIPVSAAGPQTVKAFDAEANYAGTTFTVIDVTPLNVEIDVGAVHFRGELAEFYAQITFKGAAVNATFINALLYKPDGATEALTVQRIATGFYKITYEIPGDAPTGTYALIMEAIYTTSIVEANGTSLKSFLLSPTLTGWNAWLVDIKGDIATIRTDVGTIKVSLEAINARLESIEGNIATIETDIGTIKADVDEVNLSMLPIKTTTTVGIPIGSILAAIAAIASIIAVVLLVRRRKSPS